MGRDEIRWAPRVPKEKVRRLYESEARGLLDAELVDDVGIALYLRCQSIVEVDEAKHGSVVCHRCRRQGRETRIQRSHPHGKGRDEMLMCAICGWRITWGDYTKSFRRKQLNLGGAGDAFTGYMARFERARTPREKMLAIDRLIHEFHYSYRARPELPTRPAGVNLIKGRLTDVIAFLNELTYGPETRPGIRGERERWERTLTHYRQAMRELSGCGDGA